MRVILGTFLTGLAVLFLKTLPASACEYKPFQLKITEKSKLRGLTPRGTSAEEKPKSLEFATSVVEDGAIVHSDAAFMNPDSPQGRLTWYLDAENDARLASENTMIEIYGYFQELTGGNVPESMLTDTGLEAFAGLSVNNLMNYPGTERAGKIEAAVRRIFPSDQSRKIFDKMANFKTDRGRSELGLPYFSRASFLSSGNSRKKYGDGVMLACMSLAYGRDMYVNPDPTLRNVLGSLPFEAARSSILDLMASGAIKSYNETEGKEINLNAELAGGKVKCSLKPSERYNLEPAIRMRCPAVVQKNPVVRRGPEGGSKYVQVGTKLYSAECSFDGKTINLSEENSDSGRKSSELVDFALANDPKAKSSKVGKTLSEGVIKVFNDPKAEDARLKVEVANAQCDEALTGKKYKIGDASPSTGGAKSAK